jgi:adenylate kinase
MDIYYSVSVRGGLLPKNLIFEQIKILKKFGTVLTDHLASDDNAIVDMGKTDDQIYETDMYLLQKANIVVADCTAPSLGVGFIIGRALDLNKPILCTCFSSDGKTIKISAMINGCPKIYTNYYSTMDEFEKYVRIFLIKNSTSKRIYLCGPPGSGKSTVAKKLSEKFGLVNISTGQILRDITKDKTNSLTETLNTYMLQGQLIPAEIMTKIVVDRLTDPDCMRNGFVLDGYPPSLEDLENLVSNNIHPHFVFYFKCDDKTAIKRQCYRGERVTDTKEKAKERMSVFHEKIPNYQTINEYWFANVPVIRINAELDADAVFKNIANTILNWTDGYTRTHAASYFPIEPYSLEPYTLNNVNSTRFHFHIDAPSHKDLLDVLYDVYAVCPELHGQIKVYPIRNLSLGSQIKNHGAYKSMINFHEISENQDEAFATGRLGNILDEDLINRVFAAIENRRNNHIKIMVEIEQYTNEWTVNGLTGLAKNIFDYKPHIFTTNVFDKYSKNFIKNVPPVEMHIAFDIDKNVLSNPPLDLTKLNKVCKKMGFDNGGWFIFKNNIVWAYRSNEFTYKNLLCAKAALVDQSHKLQEKLHEITHLNNINIECSLEIVHGIWMFN